MSLYNEIYGVNPATYFALPMITNRHPDSLPRFRDCFAGKMTRGKEKDQYGMPKRIVDDSKVITIFTRTGGENRAGHTKGNELLKQIDGYIEDYDDSFDSTFACWIYAIPERFIEDHELIRSGNLWSISDELQKRCLEMFPKLAKHLKDMFNPYENREG